MKRADKRYFFFPSLLSPPPPRVLNWNHSSLTHKTEKLPVIENELERFEMQPSISSGIKSFYKNQNGAELSALFYFGGCQNALVPPPSGGRRRHFFCKVQSFANVSWYPPCEYTQTYRNVHVKEFHIH